MSRTRHMKRKWDGDRLVPTDTEIHMGANFFLWLQNYLDTEGNIDQLFSHVYNPKQARYLQGRYQKSCRGNAIFFWGVCSMNNRDALVSEYYRHMAFLENKPRAVVIVHYSVAISNEASYSAIVDKTVKRSTPRSVLILFKDFYTPLYDCNNSVRALVTWFERTARCERFTHKDVSSLYWCVASEESGMQLIDIKKTKFKARVEQRHNDKTLWLVLRNHSACFALREKRKAEKEEEKKKKKEEEKETGKRASSPILLI